MQCITCKADVPPQWVNAIQKNECPGCGGQIMDDSSKELLMELKEAMSRMPNDPEGLAGWILSNYVLTKVGSGEPTGFHRRPPARAATEHGAKPGRKIKVNTNNPVQNFLKRTGVSKSLNDRKNYQEIVNQINTGDIDDTMYGESESELESEEEVEEIDYETDEPIEAEVTDEEDVLQEAEANRRQMQSMVTARKQQLKNSLLLPDASVSARPVSPREVEAVMESLAKRTGDFSSNAALNEARLKRVQAQEDIASGIRKPGSFSRG
jgi:hypothetical protein